MYTGPLKPLFDLNGIAKPAVSTNGLAGQDILSVAQFDKEKLDYVFARACEMREMVERVGGIELLKGHVLACLFYEPSTRTSSSFIAAMERLGGGVIPITQGVHFSSVSKGETLADTVRTLEQYADVIVLRHPEIGSAQLAADYASVPIINAGDGPGEHPTQALLDLFTIREELGRIDGLKVAMVGDLRYGRTVQSLTRLLLQYDVTLRFVSPEILRLPLTTMNQVINAGVSARETHDVADVIENADVLYVTRVQKERFADLSQYEEVKNYYEITPELMTRAKEKMIIMHPLPRVGEIHLAIDSDPRAAYFRQVKNGMYIRMALLAAVLGQA
jgi:carbamoyl-phosphate synthase/aspartate carbamoyltransferase/dihydroorotase/carbamoyl-phosphate synthase/aspartate carbamoyltransferase